MRIDTHSHMIPAKFVQGEDVHFPLDGTSETHVRPLHLVFNYEDDTLYNVERRLRDMDAQGLDIHVISLQPMFTYALPVERAIPICRSINNAFAEVVAGHPDRFIALADVPLQSPEDAARELERAVRDLGLKGAEITSQVNRKNLDDPSMFPFFAKAQELDVPIFIHQTLPASG